MCNINVFNIGVNPSATGLNPVDGTGEGKPQEGGGSNPDDPNAEQEEATGPSIKLYNVSHEQKNELERLKLPEENVVKTDKTENSGGGKKISFL